MMEDLFNIQIPLITRYEPRSDAGGRAIDRLDEVVQARKS